MGKIAKRFLLIYIITVFAAFVLGLSIYREDTERITYFATLFGGALGGFGTLIAVYISVQDAKRNIEIERETTHHENALQRKTEFVNKIASLIGDFEANQTKYMWGSISIERNNGVISRLQKNENPDSTIIERLQKEIDYIRFNNGGIRVGENAALFTLKTHLSGIKEAESLLQALHDTINGEDRIISDYCPENYDEKAVAEWEKVQIEKINKEYMEFRSRYLSFV